MTGKFRNDKSEQFTYTTRWDSDKLKGCQCDYPATGFDCSQQLCPNGDDPLTPGQVRARAEYISPKYFSISLNQLAQDFYCVEC